SGSDGCLPVPAKVPERQRASLPSTSRRQPAFTPPKEVVVSADRLRTYAGTYTFAPHVRLRVDASGGNLSVTALDRAVFDFSPGVVTQLVPASNTEFYFDRGQTHAAEFYRWRWWHCHRHDLEPRSVGAARQAYAGLTAWPDSCILLQDFASENPNWINALFLMRICCLISARLCTTGRISLRI